MLRNFMLYLSLVVVIGLIVIVSDWRIPMPDERVRVTPLVKSYANVSYLSYQKAYDKAYVMQEAITTLIEAPSDETLADAQQAWIDAYAAYNETEVFRFYEGPIALLENRLNVWPIHEALIDYTSEEPDAGIIQNGDMDLSPETLLQLHQIEDNMHATIGFPVIEFLLWGQNAQRPSSDFTPEDLDNRRRNFYLKTVTDILLSDLFILVEAWKPEGNNYARTFQRRHQNEAIFDMLTGMSTLVAEKFSSDINTAITNDTKANLPSRFSNTAAQYYLHVATGLKNVFHASIGKYNGTSFYDLLREKDRALANELSGTIRMVVEKLEKIQGPLDLTNETHIQTLEIIEAHLEKQTTLYQKVAEMYDLKLALPSH